MCPADWRFLSATPDNRDVPYWWDASVSFAGPHERSDELRDGVVITILLSTRAETLSPAQWLEQKEGWWESTVYASQWITKQGVRGLRTEERCTGCESSTTYYYFPLQRLLLVFAINVASTDATVRGQYQRLADRIYESFRLPTPTMNSL